MRRPRWRFITGLTSCNGEALFGFERPPPGLAQHLRCGGACQPTRRLRRRWFLPASWPPPQTTAPAEGRTGSAPAVMPGKVHRSPALRAARCCGEGCSPRSSGSHRRAGHLRRWVRRRGRGAALSSAAALKWRLAAVAGASRNRRAQRWRRRPPSSSFFSARRLASPARRRPSWLKAWVGTKIRYPRARPRCPWTPADVSVRGCP